MCLGIVAMAVALSWDLFLVSPPFFVAILPTLIVSGLLFPSLGQLSLSSFWTCPMFLLPSCIAGLASAGTSPLGRVGTVFFGWFSAVSTS